MSEVADFFKTAQKKLTKTAQKSLGQLLKFLAQGGFWLTSTSTIKNIWLCASFLPLGFKSLRTLNSARILQSLGFGNTNFC